MRPIRTNQPAPHRRQALSLTRSRTCRKSAKSSFPKPLGPWRLKPNLHFLKESGIKMTADEINMLLNELDRDGDGEINYR